jgi:hypothetical protein
MHVWRSLCDLWALFVGCSRLYVVRHTLTGGRPQGARPQNPALSERAFSGLWDTVAV